MKCPKCNYYPSFKEALGACETYGKYNWILGKSRKDGDRLVFCKTCEVGPSVVKCPKCDNTIRGIWIEKNRMFGGCLAGAGKLLLIFIIVTIIIAALAAMSNSNEDQSENQDGSSIESVQD